MRREMPKKPDVITLLARAGAGKRPKRSRAGILIALVLVGAILAGVYWLARPGKDPVPVAVIALDQVALPGETVPLRAQLFPTERKEDPPDLAGFEVYFEVNPLPGMALPPREELRQEKAVTQAGGEAEVRWKLTTGGQRRSVVVRYAGDKRRRGSDDQASVYVWAPDTALLLVEARHTLLAAGEQQFRDRNPYELPPASGVPQTLVASAAVAAAAAPLGSGPFAAVSLFRAGRQGGGTAEALEQAQAKNYQVVYLATAPARPEHYRKMRGWLQRQFFPPERSFPQGPVLGRDDYSDEQTEAAALRAAVRSLKKRFKEKMAAVARRPEDARVFAEEGVTTFLVGGGKDLPAKVEQVLSWHQAIERLP
jgi:hypothetical protein